MRLAVLPEGYESWTFDGGYCIARTEVRRAVADAVARHGSLYRWAELAPDREDFSGRGAAYGVTLGGERAVVRHARRGGVPSFFSDDWFLGAPRFLTEVAMSRAMSDIGVATPAVLAGVAYRAGIGYRADVATSRVKGLDLATLFFGPGPPESARRTAIIGAVAVLIRRLHDSGFLHPDLQLRNILMEEVTGRPAAWLLDVDTCRRFSPHDISSRRANLARFYRSWDKWNRQEGERLLAADRAAFEDAYRAGSR